MPKCSARRTVTLILLAQVTAVLEILQPSYQHVVDLSYLDKGELNFICWTLPYDDDSKGNVEAESYCAMNPQGCDWIFIIVNKKTLLLIIG